GLKLKRAMITNAVRCVPPQNKPVGAEINQCRPFLAARIAALPKLKAMICLGKISHDSTVRTLGLKLKDYPFGHGTHYDVEFEGRPLALISSYHCSRYNTNTRRLTPGMFEDVFAMAKKVTDSD
ncbi:MAG TPA: uracil-DNA glycosylase, partial [Hyphomonas sp.]|nr:uracil-DNA glycosylase [Hyphomonas sp.]